MISPSEYQNIICLIDKSLTAQSNAFNSLLEMRRTLNKMVIDDNRRNELGSVTDSQLTELNLQTPPSLQLKIFLQKLQKHVDSRYGLAAFLTDNAINIPQQVAALSTLVGYIINEQHIAECS